MPSPEYPRESPAALRRAARADPGGAGLLVGAVVAVQSSALDGPVDRALQARVLGVGSLLVAARDGLLQVAEVGLACSASPVSVTQPATAYARSRNEVFIAEV